MNPWQFAQQIKHVLEVAVWDGADGAAIFGDRGAVAVFAGMPTSEQLPIAYPFALVGIDSGDFDADHPDTLTQRFSLTIGALVAGDRMGEMAIIGGPVRSGAKKSANRGVAEISARARSYVQSLTGADGCRVLLSGVTTSPPVQVQTSSHLAMEQTTLEAVCTSQPYYDPPQRLRWSGGKWRWEGAQCQARYDFVEFVLVRKPGAQPSASPDDGTIVYTGTDAEWTGTQAGGSTYTCFAGYSDRGTTSETYSDPVRGAYRVPT